MKLFDARPNSIHTFGLRIKQYLTTSNIDFSDILETPSYFVLQLWCIKPPKVVLEKNRTDTSVYNQLFMETRDRYRDYIPYTDGSRSGNSVTCATVCPSDTVISMRLPDSASIVIAEMWAIIKSLEKIKDSFTSKYINYYRFTFVSPCFILYVIGTSLDWVGDAKVCLFILYQKGHYMLLGTQPCWHQG